MTLLLLWLPACSDPAPPPPVTSALSADSGQTDSDPPTDTAPVTDTDTGTAPWQDDLIAVVGEPGEELRFVERHTGEVWAMQNMSDWFPETCAEGPCRLLGFQHEVVDDQDVMTFAYTVSWGTGLDRVGGLLSVRLGDPGTVLWEFIELEWDAWLPTIYDGLCADGNPDERCRMGNPHTVLRMPDRNWLVADTARDRVVILEAEPEELSKRTPKQGTDTRVKGMVRQVIDATTQPESEWKACQGPNNVELWVEDDVPYALITCRGDTGDDGGMTRHGMISLWDLSDLSHPDRVWTYPKKGHIKAAHHGRVIDGPDGPWLVYGHSMGNSSDADEELGSVGLARFHVDQGPEYLGDGLLPEDLGTFGFVRSVSPMPDGEGLFIADSGCERIAGECANPGRLVEVAFPELDDPGLSGGWSEDHREQRFFDLDVTRILEGDKLGGLPYEAEYLPYESLGEPLRTRGAVRPL